VPDRFPTWSRHLPSAGHKCPQIARLQIGPRHYAGKREEYKEFKELKEYEEFEEYKNA